MDRSENTINHYIDVLKALFHFVAEKKLWSGENPIREYSKVDDFISHGLRHTASTIMVTETLGRGVGLADIMRVLGHSKVETTLRYLHGDTERMRKAVEALEKATRK